MVIDKKVDKQVKLSILLPTHNRADVLGLAIESVLNQTLSDFELLIVGDGCTDATADVVRRFQDDRIIWMDMPKAPHFGYANRNIALKQARGTYIGFAAHDDLLLSDHFDSCVEVLEQEERVDLVYTRPIWVMDDGLIFPIEFNLHDPRTRENFLAMKHNVLPASCVVHRKSIFNSVGYWNEDLPRCGDWDMWIRIIKARKEENYRFLRDPTCLHFVANWKNKPLTSGLREANHWRRLYESRASIPSVLMQDIPQGISPQAVIWNSIQKNPALYCRQLRNAVTLVFDVRVNSFESEVINLIRKNAKLSDEVKKMNVSNAAMINELESQLSNYISEMEECRIKIQKLEHSNEILINEVQALTSSYSLRWGRVITRIIVLFFGWVPGVRRKKK